MKIKIIVSFLYIIIINGQLYSNISDIFINWGLKYNLKLSSYIESLIEKNKIKFYAKTDIPKKEELLTIPNSIMFNITKALLLINSKSLNKQYKQFLQLNLTDKPNSYDFRKEETFLSYIFYLIQHKSKRYKKTKFYENFKYYLEYLDKFSVKSALFYEQEQKDFLSKTFLGYSINLLKNNYQDEINILRNNSYYKKDLDFDDYVHHRLAINNKGLNISNHWTLVPFLNFFDEDYTLYNANYTIEENGDVKIFSRRKIKKGDEIILKSKKKSNIRRLLIEGKTNEKLFDYFDEFQLPVFSPGLARKYGINDNNLIRSNYVNIIEKNFDSKATNIYLEHADILNGDGSDTWAYAILEGNLKYYKDYYDAMISKINEYFYDINDRTNIERIIRGEKKAIDKACKRVSKTVSQFMEIQTKYMSDDKNTFTLPDL